MTIKKMYVVTLSVYMFIQYYIHAHIVIPNSPDGVSLKSALEPAGRTFLSKYPALLMFPAGRY